VGKKKNKFKPPNLEKEIVIEDLFSEKSLSVFKDFGEDRNLFNHVDKELINLGGSQLSIYKYLGPENYDDLYDEDRVKLIEPFPVSIHAHYDPVVIQETNAEFGIELTNDIVFTFNKEELKNKLDRELHPGDVLRPAFQNFFYEVTEVQEDSFEAYGVHHTIAAAKIWRESEYAHKIWQNAPGFGPVQEILIEVALEIFMSDGYSTLVDVRYVRSEAVLEKLISKPIMFLAHGGPGSKDGERSESIRWAEEGFFSIAPDIRGRGLSVHHNNASINGRQYENGIRHRLDQWEIIECLYQNVGVYAPFSLPGGSRFKGGIFKGGENEEGYFEHTKEQETFRRRMDITRIASEGFSLGGGVPLYMSLDSGCPIPDSAYGVKPKNSRFNYITGELEYNERWMNPRTLKVYHEDYVAGGSADESLKDKFRDLTVAYIGGALPEAWGHFAENEMMGAIKHHFAYFMYGQKSLTQWTDPMSFEAFKDGIWEKRQPGIWVNPLYLLATEYYWEANDWISLSKFLRGDIFIDSDLDVVGDPSGFFHPGTENSWYIPDGGQEFGVFRNKYYHWYKNLPFPYTPWQSWDWRQEDLSLSAWIQEWIDEGTPNAEGSTPYDWTPQEGEVWDTSGGRLTPPVENFGTKTLPALVETFADASSLVEQWIISSTTNIGFYLGYDDIFMSPTQTPYYFQRRMNENKATAETVFSFRHSGTHGVPAWGREGVNGLIDLRKESWIKHYIFGEPLPEKDSYHWGSKFNATVVPNDVSSYQGLNPDHKRQLVKFNSYPPPMPDKEVYKLVSGEGTNQSFPQSYVPNPGAGVMHPTMVEHKLWFELGEGDNIEDFTIQDSTYKIRTVPLPLGETGEEYRIWWRRSVEAWFKNFDSDGVMVPPKVEDHHWVSGMELEFDPIDFNSSALLLGAPSATFSVSSDSGTFQLWTELIDVDTEGGERYITGGLYSQVSATEGSGPLFTFTYDINPYAYIIQAGHQLKVKVRNYSLQAPPYLSANDVFGAPGSKFSLDFGVFTGLPSFEEFKILIDTGGSYIDFPFNNSIPLEYM
jgi:hypothetical protein